MTWLFSDTGQESALAEHAKEKDLPHLPQQAESIVDDKINSLLSSSGKERVPILREAMQRLMTEKCSVFRNGDVLEQARNEICQLEKRQLNVGLSNKGRIFNYELQEAFELR